jgi:hypothetical protein
LNVHAVETDNRFSAEAWRNFTAVAEVGSVCQQWHMCPCALTITARASLHTPSERKPMVSLERPCAATGIS